MSTDWFDGRIARRSGRTSSFGSLLDPVADKVLVLGTLVVLLDQRVFRAWMVAAIVARELLISGLRLAALERGVVIVGPRPREAQDLVAGDRGRRRRARRRRAPGATASRGGSCSSRSPHLGLGARLRALGPERAPRPSRRPVVAAVVTGPARVQSPDGDQSTARRSGPTTSAASRASSSTPATAIPPARRPRHGLASSSGARRRSTPRARPPPRRSCSRSGGPA